MGWPSPSPMITEGRRDLSAEARVIPMESTRSLHGPGALIAAIPTLLGFAPRESVVVVSLRHRGEVGVILRVDRADCVRPDSAAPLARALAGHLSRDQAEAAVLVSFTEDDVRLACPALDAIRPVIAEVIDDVECWAVRSGRFFSPGCARESCCPTRGRPIPPSDPTDAPVVRVSARPHRLSGANPDGDYDVDEPARRRSARAGERWWAHRDADPTGWRKRSFTSWKAALTATRAGTLPSDAVCGKLIAALQDRRFRDAVLISLMPGSGKVSRGVLDGTADEEVSRVLRVLVSPEDGVRPDPALIANVWSLLGWLTAHARVALRAPTLTLSAVLAWWDGDEGACRSLLLRAHESEPGYRLAALLECTLLAGIDPGWKRAA